MSEPYDSEEVDEEEKPGLFKSIMNLIRASSSEGSESEGADTARRDLGESITRKLPKSLNGIKLMERNQRLQRRLDEVDRFGRK